MALLSDGTAQYAHLWIIESCDDLGMSLFLFINFSHLIIRYCIAIIKKKTVLEHGFLQLLGASPSWSF